ncbi:MAG: SAM-dependent DNA methyltransferase [Bacteroidales bacterium]|nr:SAM-dependent DNA methyltransferase [Bacteroidales bacterium]
MLELKNKHISEYLQKVKSANKELTKKEAFKDLLNRLYFGDNEITKIIDEITAGAERTVVNIPRKDKFHRGSADTLYNKIIIEFENELKVSLNHCKEQLSGYFLGQFNTGEGYNFTLIASDFINWKVFAPDVSQLDILETITEDKLILNEVISASFTLTENNIEDFYFWIDRFLFKEEKQKATLKRIEEAFGYQSNVFIECFREMSKHFQDIKKYGEIQVSYEQWKKFLSIAYGSFDASENNFLIHTYLSVFSKMLAYSIFSNDDYINDDEMLGIIDGSIFHKYNIRNFVDNDFFYWIKNEKSFKALKKVFRIISQEISTYDFQDVEEDILKGVYQELIDLDTRHSLGEYYTPDWLCERIVKEFSFKQTDKILDPSCGSGSFLRAVIHRIKKQHSNISVEQLNENIFGIDIHPLSVQIAKTTMLLALGKEILESKKPIHINIILANTLLAPEGVESLFGNDFKLKIDKDEYLLNTQILEEIDLFDEGLEVCEELAEQTLNRREENEIVFENILRKKFPKKGFNGNITSGFYNIYLGLKSVKEKGRDSIWKFILQNIYKPYFLQQKFDYIIGNPPWFTYSSIKNEEYQDILNELAVSYNVKPENKANYPHLEIAAIFLAHCSNYFLKEQGEIAFVVPRSFFSADHHDNTRSGKTKGFRLKQFWDLQNVSQLFRIPCGVLFAVKTSGKRALPASGLTGKSFTGILPAHNCNWKTAEKKLSEKEEKYFYVQQGKASALSNHKVKKQNNINPYKNLFKQGATIVPRTFYFVELNQEKPPDFKDRIINIKTPEAIFAEAKKPWKGEIFKGQIESQFLFYSALSKSILPFALFKPNLVVLPITIEHNKAKSKNEIKLFSFNEIRREGYLKASKWFENKENIWNILKTEKNKKISSENYLNWQNKLTDQNINSKYLVLYNSSAKDANATVVIRSELDLEFIVESKAYVFYTNILKEAYYLTAILNSSITNLMMKDFQTKGLFGARDVHKKILDIYFPKFDENNELHKKLSSISIEAHKKVKNYLKQNPPQQELTAMHLGRLRLAIKKHLTVEFKEIDKLVKKII